MSASPPFRISSKSSSPSTSSPPKMSIKQKEFYDLYSAYIQSSSLEEEFEVRFGTKGIKPITKIDFDNVISYVKSKGFQIKEVRTTLKMQPEYFDAKSGRSRLSNIRVELDNEKMISEYCSNNDLHGKNNMLYPTLRFQQKKPKYKTDGSRYEYIDYSDFNFRVSYQEEQTLDVNTNFVREIINNWADKKKIFRLVQRYSFTHSMFPEIQIDMSIVRTSKRNDKGNMIPTFNVVQSNVMNTNQSYEIEIEHTKKDVYAIRYGDGNNILKYFKSLQTVIQYILCGLQQTNYPISYPEMTNIGHSYMRLLYGKDVYNERRLKPRDFIGPSSISLELKNIVPLNPDNNTPNIRNPYTVTDKADGIRKLLYIHDNGKIYMIDTNMNIQFTGAVTSSIAHRNSLLDGEHVLHNKNGEFINLYAVFDVYVIQGDDKRSLPFFQTNDENDKTKDPVNFRHNLFVSFVNTLNPEMVASGGTPLRIENKSFYASMTGDDERSSIFAMCNTIMGKIQSGAMEYETDGLIFTPSKLGVGMDSVSDTNVINYKKTWLHSFKWKPPQYNTIDFLVKLKQDEKNKDVIGTLYNGGTNTISGVQIVQYKTCILHVGFDEKRHGYINPCLDVYEGKIPSTRGDMDNDDEYRAMPFIPSNPTDTKAYIMNVVLKNNASNSFLYTEDGNDIIEDNMIVECRYDKSKDEEWRWIPIRVRYDKTAELRAGLKNYGNAYHVAQSVWASIHNPVTTTMITTGTNIPDELADDDVYYNRTGKSNTRILRDFHNLYVKRKLIMGASRRGGTLLDLAVGKGGDFPKWIASGLSFVFGVDVSKDNIENRIDGACARYLNYRKEYSIMPKALFVQANSSLNLRSGEASFSEKGRDILRAIYGHGSQDETRIGKGVIEQYGRGKNGFNVVSCQFALHYFFENTETLHNLLRNVAEGCANGGYFIGTCYDGKKIFNLLRGKLQGVSVAKYNGEEKIWEITKDYDEDEMKNDETCVGMKIDVYQDSINKVFGEYLVNFDYLDRLMESYGFTKIEKTEAKRMGLPNGSGGFEELFRQMQNDIRKTKVQSQIKTKTELEVGSSLDLLKDTNQKEISFLNRYFVYKKINQVDIHEVYSTGLGKSITEQIREKQTSSMVRSIVDTEQQQEQEEKPKETTTVTKRRLVRRKTKQEEETVKPPVAPEISVKAPELPPQSVAEEEPKKTVKRTLKRKPPVAPETSVQAPELPPPAVEEPKKTPVKRTLKRKPTSTSTKKEEKTK